MLIAKYLFKISIELSNEFPNKSLTKYSIENLRYCPTNCIHIRIFDFFLAFESDSLPFSSPDTGYRAAVFQVCKICAFNQSNAIVLTAKCKIFF